MEPPKKRKSVGAEVNWGVRFQSDDDARRLLDSIGEGWAIIVLVGGGELLRFHECIERLCQETLVLNGAGAAAHVAGATVRVCISYKPPAHIG